MSDVKLVRTQNAEKIQELLAQWLGSEVPPPDLTRTLWTAVIIGDTPEGLVTATVLTPSEMRVGWVGPALMAPSKQIAHAVRHFLPTLMKGPIIKLTAAVGSGKPAESAGMKFGFKREGINRASRYVGEELIDDVYLGLVKATA